MNNTIGSQAPRTQQTRTQVSERFFSDINITREGIIYAIKTIS